MTKVQLESDIFLPFTNAARVAAAVHRGGRYHPLFTIPFHYSGLIDTISLTTIFFSQSSWE